MEPSVSGPYRDFDTSPGSTHNLVVSLVPRGARVLEIGCAAGHMSEVLRSRLGCSVAAIEISPAVAEIARRHCDRIVVGDAETVDFEVLFGGDRFDAIVFADVLEHLRDPGTVLQRIRPFLADGGAVIASIPNFAHGSVRLALLGGEFHYRDTGLLDRTHLRFFTRETVEDLFETSGYVITQWLRRRLAIEASEIGPPDRPVPQVVHDWLAAEPEVTTYQFVVRAVPSAAGHTNYEQRARARQARTAREWSERAQRAAQELATVVAPDSPFILVDEDRIRSELPSRHRAWPFPERNGQYWGPPLDDVSAIEEVERLRRHGARFVVVAWPAFWWLDFYGGLERHLRSRYRRILETERLVVFELQRPDNAPVTGP
jgi:2-polyprenyl-3-methyl-5-hydroxy-6-metoxy-1,4-benzoquinol methylase